MNLSKEILKLANENMNTHGSYLDGVSTMQKLNLTDTKKYLESLAYLEHNQLIKVHRTLDANKLRWSFEPTTSGMAFKLIKTPWYKSPVFLGWLASSGAIIAAIVAILTYFK